MISFTRLAILLLATTLTSCFNTSAPPTQASTPVDTGTSAQTKVIERFYPEENVVTVSDTTDAASGIRITITEKTLDTYVTNEHGNDSVKYVDKYRDTEWMLKVSRDGDVVVDTVLHKEHFTGHLDNEFLGIANFHGYWIRKIEPDRIEFFGVIAKPETDWSFAFYHYVDLKTGRFEIKEHVDEEM